MTVNQPYGFIESDTLNGTNSPVTRLYKIAAGGRSGQWNKYIGDPVVLCSGTPTTDNDVIGVASADNTNGTPVLGVIRALYGSSNGKPKPLTFSQPTNGPILLASVAGFAEVNVGIEQTYRVATDTTALSNIVGQYVVATVGTPNTNSGASGFMIKATGVNTATTTYTYQVVGVAPRNIDYPNTGSNTDYEVKIALHAFGAINPSLRSK